MKLIFQNKKLVFLVFLMGLILLSNSASAHLPSEGLWTPGQRIVPCTDNCTKCDLFHLLKHLIDFIMVAAAPIIATLFLIIAGVHIMMGGANPGMLATGKRMFKDTMIGILIVMLAWLITNTLIRSLADPSKVGQGGNWYEFTCTP